MPKLAKKSKVAEATPTPVEEKEVLTEDAVSDTMDTEATDDLSVQNPAKYIDPMDFVYEIKAGKTYTGFNALEVIDFVASLIGKTDKITITKLK